MRLLAKYRSKIEIVADMLSVTRNGAKKTHIMYQGNLSSKLLNVYMKVITKAGLIRFIREKDCYVLTRKGQAFLETFRKHNRRFIGLKKQINQVQHEIHFLERMCFESSLCDDHKSNAEDRASKANIEGVKNDDSRLKPNRLVGENRNE